MNPLKNNQNIIFSINSLGQNGEGVGTYQGYTIFVEGALPGERVQVRLDDCRKRYAKATLLEVIESSPHRVEPLCRLFGTCGGCQLMHVAYNQQLIMKQQKVIDSLQNKNIIDCRVEPCLPSPSQIRYRNKLQFPVKAGPEGLTMGLYTRSSQDLIEISTCHTHCDLAEEVFHKVEEILKRSKITAYDAQTGKGLLRHILMKSSSELREVLVVLVTASECTQTLLPIAQEIMGCSPYVKGVVQNINEEKGNIILGTSYQLLAGSSSIRQQLGNLVFNISAASFFQINTQQAHCLYTKALELAEVTGQETVLDAYCGVGTISLFFAAHVKKVIGIECVPEAIEDAKKNAALNHIHNADFICAQAEEYIKNIPAIDLIILNPPRKGCEQSFLEAVQRLRPNKLIYISCDPSTLARDLSFLRFVGYTISVIQPFDMFPQTSHVECVVKLELRATDSGIS